MHSLLRRFIGDERGVFAVIFGLMSIVLIALGGAVVDYVNLENARNRAQGALDAAALALQEEVFLEPLPDEENVRLRAEALIRQQVGPNATIYVRSAMWDVSRGSIRLSASVEVQTLFVSLVGITSLSASVVAEAARGHSDIEIALALDVTGSMRGQRIADLKLAAKELIDIVMGDVKPGSTSRIALVPYSVGVNLGPVAVAARGPVEPAHDITAAYWAKSPDVSISNITRTNPVVVTALGHGLSAGASVFLSGISGMTEVNGKAFTVGSVSGNTFTLQGVDGRAFRSYSSGGRASPCVAAACEVVVTAPGNNFAAGQIIYLKDVGGMREISNRLFRLRTTMGSTLSLEGTFGPSYGAYSSGGEAYCVLSGCRYYYFRNMLGGMRFFEISSCVSERTNFAFTDLPPSASYVGRNYAASANPCSLQPISPLSVNAELLKSRINDLEAGGSTGGHLGVAWAWYMLSPKFGYIWPAPENRPGEYGDSKLSKIAIIMTDGEYNSVYCDGVISRDSTSGSGSPSDHINCDAPNGDPYYQATQYCIAMKNAGITVYTIGFQIIDSAAARGFMSSCASSMDHTYLAEDGAALRQAFVDIAQSIQMLRLTQ